MRLQGVDELSASRALSATGLLARLNRDEVLDAADVHVAVRAGTLVGEADEDVLLALALTVRALRAGSTCLDLSTVVGPGQNDAGQADAGQIDPGLNGPDRTGSGAPGPAAVAPTIHGDELPAYAVPDNWAARIAASPLAADPPILHVEGDLVFLDRYWREEVQVCEDLLARIARPVDAVDQAQLQAGLDRLFPATGWGEQRAATAIAVGQGTTVLTGGPGTGKTSTVAALLAVLAEHAETGSGRPLRIALTAPTGKAAARLNQSVTETMEKWGEAGAPDRARLADLEPMTLHRLLGSRRDSSTRFRHHRDNRLAHDVVVVDESSMLSLTMMARLLEALRPETRLVLVGDPFQLASIDAGAVLSDLVDGLNLRNDIQVAELTTSHRFGESIGRLAEAIRDESEQGADAAIAELSKGDTSLEFIEVDDVEAALHDRLLDVAWKMRQHAAAGEVDEALAQLDAHRLLCAHREGSRGVNWWNRQVERWLGEKSGDPMWDQWYVGRPVLVTANDYGLGVFNGDTGVTVLGEDGDLRVHIQSTTGVRDFAPSRLSDVQTLHAMTIHKAQGGQAREITVLMPDDESRLLTRELFYTAVTRAEEKVTVVGSEAVVRAAVQRKVRRASGLRERILAGT